MKQPPQPPPPKLAQRFLRWFLRDELYEEVQGDLEEMFEYRLEQGSTFKAKLDYCYQVLHYLRPFAIRLFFQNSSFTTIMIRHNFLISWRRLMTEKSYAALHIGGLALGMTVAILIGLWVWDELTYNTYHDNYDHIAQVMRFEMHEGEKNFNSVHVSGAGYLLREQFQHQFEHVVMVRARLEERVIAFGQDKFTQQGYFMNPEGPEMFSLKMTYGSRAGLQDMNTILLSESLANKLFGEENPVNQVITMDAKNELLVTGVYEDLPRNTSFYQASFLAPLDLFHSERSSKVYWNNYDMYIYAQVKPGVDWESISNYAREAIMPHLPASEKADYHEVFLQPMSKWHLHSEFEKGQQVISDRLRFVWLYGIVGIFVLLLACINFTNLSTARSERRAKEVGIRKSVGSLRSQLILQFLSESILIALSAFVVSVGLVYAMLPWFNQMADKAIEVDIFHPGFWLLGLGFIILTGILAGSYPAFYLSSFVPVKVLKGTTFSGKQTALSRKILVIFQFTVSIALVIGTVIIYQQIQYAKTRPVGYDQEGLIMISPNSPNYQEKYQVLMTELKRLEEVEEVAVADYAITSNMGWNSGFIWKGKASSFNPAFNIIEVSHDYGKTLDLEFIQGRDFSRTYPTDSRSVIINESAAKLMGLENPVGEWVEYNPRYGYVGTFQIIGVVKDIVKKSPFEDVDQAIIFLSEERPFWLFIRMNPNVSASQALPVIETTFNQILPSDPFDYTFVDEAYGEKFREEERVGKLVTFFAVLAILISCLGLLGLAAYVVERRSKEMGIRKVLGASVLNLWQMLSQEFVLLVIVSCLIATPLAYYMLDSWLGDYAYRIKISWWLFVTTGLGVLLLTLLIVSAQTLKAATVNPVDCLRDE